MTTQRAADPDPGSTRVADAHRHARRGLAVSGAFVVAAVVAAITTDEIGAWLALHLFVLGALTSAVAAVTQMLAVTWSTAPAPSDRVDAVGRWGIAIGAALVVVGRESSDDALIAVGGTLVATGLIAVTAILVEVRRRAQTPRFAPAIGGYVLALTAALAGVALGVALATGRLGGEARNAHILLNLFAFIGVVIAATLPYFTATQARSKMAKVATPLRITVVTGGMWLSAVAATGAAALGVEWGAKVGLGVYAIGLVGLATLLPRPRRKQIEWAGPRLLQLFAGIGWWLVATVWIAAAYDPAGVDRTATIVLVVGAYGQILSASLAYLVPVVRGGGHERLTGGLRATRSWTALVLGNAAAALAATGHTRLLAVAVVGWGLDTIVRLATAAGLVQRSPRAPAPPSR